MDFGAVVRGFGFVRVGLATASVVVAAVVLCRRQARKNRQQYREMWDLHAATREEVASDATKTAVTSAPPPNNLGGDEKACGLSSMQINVARSDLAFVEEIAVRDASTRLLNSVAVEVNEAAGALREVVAELEQPRNQLALARDVDELKLAVGELYGLLAKEAEANLIGYASGCEDTAAKGDGSTTSR